MSFILEDNTDDATDNAARLFWFPVVVELLDRASGRRKKFQFDGQFEEADQPDLIELFRKREEGEERLKDTDVLDRYFHGWRKIDGPDGQPVPVTPENRDRLLKKAGVAKGLVNAFLKAHGLDGLVKN